MGTDTSEPEATCCDCCNIEARAAGERPRNAGPATLFNANGPNAPNGAKNLDAAIIGRS